MCLPLIAAAAVVSAVASGGVAAYGSYQQGQAQKAQYNYQAAVAQQQANLAQRNADQNSTIVAQQGAAQSQAAARKALQVQGAQTAAMAANGVAGSVTSSDVKVDAFDTAKLDQLSIQYNTNLKQYGIQNDAQGQIFGLNTESQEDQIAGKNAEFAGNIGAASSILSTASQVAGTGLQYKSLKARGIK